jgi:hypothetical protein
MKMSKKIFSFFSAVNQYFLHIPYVASKKLWGFSGICTDVSKEPDYQLTTCSTCTVEGKMW